MVGIAQRINLHCIECWKVNEYPWSVFLLQKSEIDPRWVDFAKLSNLTKVRVSADSHSQGDQGLGTGLAVRRPPVVQSSIIGYLILAGPL
jgi:hypothetical protein